MKIDEFIAKKGHLQSQLDELSKHLDEIKNDAILEIKRYITEFDITFIQMQHLYESLNLSTATIQIAKNKPPIPDRKGYVYFNSNNGRWFNGYNAIPKWFDLAKADSYLIPGKSHTPLVIQAIKANGLDKNQVKEAFTAAQIKEFKDTADQFTKLFRAKRLTILDEKIDQNREKIEQISRYLDKDIASYVFEMSEI